MTTTSQSNAAPVDLVAIVALVNQGKTVVSTEDSTVVELALNLLEERRSATLYLKDSLFREILRRRNGTDEGAATFNLEPVSAEEAARIKADFNIELDGGSSRECCPRCAAVYGAYQFIQQGIKEHGEHAVKAVFSLKGVSVLQINPRQNIRCQSCGLDLDMYPVRYESPAGHPSSGGVVASPRVLRTKVGPHGYLYRDTNHSYGCCR